MADPKYANLPGIDTESRDVYECGDLPEEDQNHIPEELSSTSVELVDTHGAFEKFSGKYVSGFGKDFSGRIQSSKMSGYSANEFGLAAPGDEETVFQKFNRLKIEVAELLQDVNSIKSSKTENKSAVNLIKQVEGLQMQLFDGNIEEISNDSVQTGPDVDALISKLKTSTEPKGKPVGEQKQDGTYQLYLKPAQEQKQNLRASGLEQRLARLEKVLGFGTDQLNVLTAHSQKATLQDAVQIMEAKLSLLDPDQLPQVDSRLQAILNKVNEINKAHKASGDQPSEINKKISELYNLVQKWEGVRVGLPQLIGRMRSLDVLHSKSCDFTTTLAHLESMQMQITARLDAAGSTQKKLEETFKENIATIKSNIVQLDQRMANLAKK